MTKLWRLADSLLLLTVLIACGKASASKALQPEAPKPSEIGQNPSLNPADPQSTLLGPSTDLWVDGQSQAALDARLLQETDPSAAKRLQYIANQPMAHWLGEWSGDIESRTRALAQASNAQSKILSLVVYNIPFRDCGSYSSGGIEPAAYRQWISALKRGLGSSRAWIILEPDALAQADCLDEMAKTERFDLLKYALETLKQAPGTRVYLDAGHPAWKSVDAMAELLLRSGMDKADGFALNVSNFQTLESNRDYGSKLSAKLGNKSFVIDTSRNGLGPDPQGEWCNPRSRGLGPAPTLNPWPRVDALLWIKRPGESDGSCNGGPGAGQWWREMALELASGFGF